MRIISVFSTFVFGIASIALGFIWVQGNMTLPGELHRYFWEKLSWPWLPLEESSLVIRAIVDESLVCIFFLFTYLLNFSIHRQKIFPARIRRSVQLSITGILFFTVISCWQHTGIVIWSGLASGTAFSFLTTLVALIYYVLVALFLFQLPAYEAQSKRQTWIIALGLEQLYSNPAEAEKLSLPLKMQRISLLLLIGATLAGIPMSLDRLLFALPLGLLVFRSGQGVQVTG
jgi:hypothetical protein